MADKKHKAGSHIALRGLSTKIEAITGKKVDLTKAQPRKTASALTQNIKGFNFSGSAVLCIDCSGSMDVGKDFLEAKRGAISFCRDAIAKGYSVGIVGFGSEVWPVSNITDDLSALEISINRLSIQGTTNMAGAIALARSFLVDTGKSQGTICIVTDGLPDDLKTDNEGYYAQDASAPESEKEAVTSKNLGLEIMCLGIEGAFMPVLERIASTKELSEQCSSSDMGNRIGMMTSHLKLENKK